MTRFVLALAVAASAPGVPAADPPKPVELTFDDQFDKKPKLSAHRGGVVVLVYSDRKGMDEAKALGESLHVAFHPTAKGLPGAKAKLEPVLALPGIAAGKASPGVLVQAVACCGKVPNVVRGVVRGQVKVGAPDVPVWLDFDDIMTTYFGMTTGKPNAVVFDANGYLRHTVTGTPDAKQTQELMQIVQDLRAEAVK